MVGARKKGGEREAFAETFFNLGEEAHGQQRVSAQFEEVIGYSDRFDS